MLYEILKSAKLGTEAAPDMFTGLIAYKMPFAKGDGEIAELSGVPPLRFKSNGKPLLDWQITGNTVQNGTPTPSNPVDVNGVGEMTENLWNETYSGILQDVITYLPLNVGNGDYTLSSTVTREGQAAVLFLLAGNVSTGATTVNDGVWSGQSRTVTAVGGYVTIGYRKYPTENPENANTMLNTGSTAKPYEPWGYKIPISNGQQTTNIYLGSTQTVRQVKKLVLGGTENWTYEATYSRFYISVNDFSSLGLRTTPFLSNAFVSVSDGRPIEDVPDNTIYSGATGNDVHKIYIKCTSYTSADEFKAYLQQQYATGTPVTVWYVLATPETSTVNEPLMKIGTYADTLSNATAIPTTKGANSITVDTTVQPSKVYIKYKK